MTSGDLDIAIGIHQQGQVERAAALYQEILRREPEHPDALHLLGVTALQRGNPGLAAQLIGRAISGDPSVAAYHANLAEAYRSSGHWEQAAGCCLLALRLQPDYPEAANNLGVIRLAQGQAADAVARFREAIRLRPVYAQAWNNLGNALRVTGNRTEVLAHFREAVRLDPNLAEARCNLGQWLLENDEPHEALVHCREAVRLRPDFVEAINNLGNVHRELEQMTDAKALYAAAIRMQQSCAMSYNNMAQALQEEGKLDEALFWYHQAIDLNADQARFHANLASVLVERELTLAAVAEFEAALRLDPAYVEARNGLGALLGDLGRFEEGAEHIREAVRLRPDSADNHVMLGNMLEQAGDLTAAETSFREALRLKPEHAGALTQLATLLRGRLPSEDAAALQRVVARSEPTEGRRIGPHFALAHVLDARGAHDEAAKQLERGNALRLAAIRKRGDEYQPESHRRFVDQMIATHSRKYVERVRGFGLETERPIFVFGLPRSGTTLTEQILASHPQVFGAGELRFIRETFQSLPSVTSQSAPPLECLHALDGEAMKRIAQAYLDHLASLNAAASRVTDKMPENYLYLGFITTLFPNARLIHCRRDLRDVALSCWSTNFSKIHWSFDQEAIVAHFREYRRLMEHWGRVLTTPVLAVRYESLVENLEIEARRLIAWCGLEWDSRCLTFHETRRPVRTASVTQVRRPVYKGSVGRWVRYVDTLAPLFAPLGEWIDASATAGASAS